MIDSDKEALIALACWAAGAAVVAAIAWGLS